MMNKKAQGMKTGFKFLLFTLFFVVIVIVVTNLMSKGTRQLTTCPEDSMKVKGSSCPLGIAIEKSYSKVEDGYVCCTPLLGHEDELKEIAVKPGDEPGGTTHGALTNEDPVTFQVAGGTFKQEQISPIYDSVKTDILIVKSQEKGSYCKAEIYPAINVVGSEITVSKTPVPSYSYESEDCTAGTYLKLPNVALSYHEWVDKDGLKIGDKHPFYAISVSVGDKKDDTKMSNYLMYLNVTEQPDNANSNIET